MNWSGAAHRLAVVPALAMLFTTNFAHGQAAPAPPGYHIVDRIPMSDGWWDYASFDPNHRRLLISRGNGVFKYDVDTGLIDQRFIPGSEGRAVIFLPGGDMALANMAGYSTAILFATDAEGKVAKMFDLTQASDAAVYEPIGRQIWVMGSHGEISLLDPVRKQQTGEVEAGEALEFAATDGHGRIYVNAPASATVIAIDARSRKIVGRWPMKDCQDPSGLAYAAGADVILSVCANKLLKILDARTGAELETVAVGAGADAVIYDEETHRAFIPSGIDGLLTVVDISGHKKIRVIEQVRTQVGTRTGAIDTKTGTLYLPSARFGPINKLGWSEALPGTVELLVMRPGHWSVISK